MTLATRLREARERQGLSLAQAAERAGVSRQYWHRYETGDVIPSAPGIIALCRALDMSADWLLGLSAKPTTGPAPES